MEKLINKFWNGKIPLWKSYWLVGELSNALFILAIFNFEIYFFKNNQFSNSLPFLDFSNFSILSKLFNNLDSFYHSRNMEISGKV